MYHLETPVSFYNTFRSLFESCLGRYAEHVRECDSGSSLTRSTSVLSGNRIRLSRAWAGRESACRQIEYMVSVVECYLEKSGPKAVILKPYKP
jgi:hypothetical protein